MVAVKALLATVLLAVVFVPAAGAKLGNVVVLVGADGRSFVQPLVPGMWSALGKLEPGTPTPRAGYLLAYPMLREGLPARPGRWYPQLRIYCSGWRSGIEAGCGRMPDGVARGLAGRRGVSPFYREPTTLARLTRAGVPLPVAGNYAAAIELAFAMRPAKRPAPPWRPWRCTAFRAEWRGPAERTRSTGFCISRAGGLYAGGTVFPLAPPTARAILG